MPPCDRLQPDPCPNPPQEIVKGHPGRQPAGPVLRSIHMPAMLMDMDRFDLKRLNTDHVDAEARINIPKLHQQQRPHPLGRCRRARQPNLDHLHRLVRAVAFHPQQPRPLTCPDQPCLQRRQQPINRSRQILDEADGFR